MTPVLSLVLCSRNDSYMGNSRWRLETTLNYTADRIDALGGQAEVLVADWGSDVPLREVLRLGPAAARLVSFVEVPPPLATSLQGDSPFPEVLALNAAARRARGTYIGRIDQDTLVGERFLRLLFAWAGGGAPFDRPLDEVLFFANRRSIPYRLAVCCPPLPVIERFVSRFGRRLRIETGKVFYNIDVGIWLLHRRLWEESGGYDERMIFMNDMEIDMATRLMTKYPMIDLGKLVGYDFYHLDHYHPGGSRSSATHRAVNSQRPRTPLGFRPSGDDWGLAQHSLVVRHQAPGTITPHPAPRTPHPAPGTPHPAPRTPHLSSEPLFFLFAGYAAARVALDRLIYPFYPVWRRRASLAWSAVRGQSVFRWPGLLRRIWVERPSARAR